MKKYTYSDCMFGCVGQENERDTYYHVLFFFFGFGTPDELARQGDKWKFVWGPKTNKPPKKIMINVFVMFLTNEKHKYH